MRLALHAGGEPRVEARRPTRCPATPVATSLDIGPRGSPVLRPDPVPHAAAPVAKSLDIGPRGRAASPVLRAEHSSTRSAQG